MLINTPQILCTSVFFFWGGGREWALIPGWALNRINTVSQASELVTNSFIVKYCGETGIALFYFFELQISRSVFSHFVSFCFLPEEETTEPSTRAFKYVGTCL